jgi:predicted TIM-barrel fold metal-dependent hydrolase
MTKLVPPPDPHPKTPRLKVPAGAADCHFHVYGPETKYPMLADRDHTAPDALPSAARHLFDTLGIERAVIVQPSVYGTDNRRQIDAIAEIGIDMRAVVIIPPDISEAELNKLDDAGARGVRMISGHRGVIDYSNLERIADRNRELGWHIEFLIWPEHIVEFEKRMAKLSCPIVIDHLAFIHSDNGLEQPAFQSLLRLAEHDHCWLKLSAGNRLSPNDPPYPDLFPYIQKVLKIGTDRLVWGSDWPHNAFFGRMPNTTDLLDLLLDWVPDESIRNKILTTNAARLYGFWPDRGNYSQAGSECRSGRKSDPWNPRRKLRHASEKNSATPRGI